MVELVCGYEVGTNLRYTDNSSYKLEICITHNMCHIRSKVSPFSLLYMYRLFSWEYTIFVIITVSVQYLSDCAILGTKQVIKSLTNVNHWTKFITQTPNITGNMVWCGCSQRVYLMFICENQIINKSPLMCLLFMRLNIARNLYYNI